MILSLFILSFYENAINICVERTDGKCKNLCKDVQGEFDITYQYFPDSFKINSSNINIYYADEDNIPNSYSKTNNIIAISCDPSIFLKYNHNELYDIMIKDDLEIPSNNLKIRAPLKIISTNNLKIYVDTKDQYTYQPIILESVNENKNIDVIFYSDTNFDNLISISSNSKKLQIVEITENVRKLFQSTDMLDEISKTYYCVSDKESKCEQYSSYDLVYVKSMYEVKKFPNVVIIDSSTTQILKHDYNLHYTHVICMEGSNVILFIYERYYSSIDYYAIIHENSIEMKKSFFEGKGGLTLVTDDKFYIHSTTTNSNIDLSLRVFNPFSNIGSRIRALKPDSVLSLVNKIKVKEPLIYHGPESLSGLFEPDKYIVGDLEIVNVTSGILIEYPYDDISYYYDEGTYEIPAAWKNSCSFNGKSVKETTLIFNNVIKYNGNSIDDVFDVRNAYLIIKPSKYFYLTTFPNYYNLSFTLKIEQDILIKKGNSYQDYYPDEHTTDCKIIGSGTIQFYELDYLENVKKFCQIEETVKLEYYNKSYPTINTCVGQSSLEECKSEIADIEKYNDVDDWLWVRNVNSLFLFESNNSFITNKQRSWYFNWYILTAHAEYILESRDIRFTNESVNNIVGQSKTSKLVIFFYCHGDNFELNFGKFNELSLINLVPPKTFDFSIYCYDIRTKLSLYYDENFEPESIPLKSCGVVYIREQYYRMIGIFKMIDPVDFATNYDFTYERICYADNLNDCNLIDFVFASNIEELLYYDNNSISTCIHYIIIAKNTTLYLNEYKFKCNYISDDGKNVKVTCYIPNNAKIYFDYTAVAIISNAFNLFLIDDITVHVEDTLFLDTSNYFYDKINLITSKNTLQIIPSTQNANSYYQRINISENIIITSPVPSRIQQLFKYNTIVKSDSWSYFYMSEEGKKMLDFDSTQFKYFNDDENLGENIVLAVGNNDVLKIPTNWTRLHNVYILHDPKARILIDKPLNITYLIDGIILNGKYKIINGNIDIKVPQSFALSSHIQFEQENVGYMYDAKLLCNENIHTNVFIDFIILDFEIVYFSKTHIINFEGFNSTNGLTFYLDNANDMHNLGLILDLNSQSGVNYNFDYDYICYSSDNEIDSNCIGKYFHADDITSILNAIKENPGLEISLYMDLTIPYPTGDIYLLNPTNKNIVINLPDSPKSILILEDNLIIIKYEESTLIQISNQSIINVEINNDLELEVKGETDSQITFSLGSDVLVSTKSNINSNFSISVKLNSFHLYALNANQFGNIFGDLIESINRVCAYDSDAYSMCSYDKTELIEKVFTDPFEFADVEIALSSNPIEINLPSISIRTDVNILPTPTSLTVGLASIVSISSESIKLNEFWRFNGNRKILIIKLNESSSISLVDQLTTPIVFQLTCNQSFIDLKNCAIQSSSLITIKKFDDTINDVTFYASSEIFTNFKNAIAEHDGISLIRNGTKKYLCICDVPDSCNKCREGIEGKIETSNQLLSDPGENVDIRIFSNFEMSSNLFTNEHDVLIDPEFAFNLTDVKSVDQNFTDRLKVEKLYFKNVSNLLLKPDESTLNITLKKHGEGMHFTIEIDTYLKLNIPNKDEIGVNASRLYVKGKGELNLYNFPYDKIRTNEKEVKVIKGVYTICNSNAGNNFCSYSTSGYRLLGNRNGFGNEEFDSKSKIVVFLNSFQDDIDANINYLSDQNILFVRKSTIPHGFLDEKKQNRIRFISTTELTSRSDLSIQLGGFQGGALLNSSDSDLFVVGFDKNLTIKQEGEAAPNSNSITLQPLDEKVTIFVDESVDIEKQKIKIEIKDEKPVSIAVLTNKEVSDSDLLNKFFEADPEKVTINIIFTTPAKSKNGGLPKGAIIGIAVGTAVIVIAVVVVVLIVILKKNKIQSVISSDNSNNLSDSTF